MSLLCRAAVKTERTEMTGYPRPCGRSPPGIRQGLEELGEQHGSWVVQLQPVSVCVGTGPGGGAWRPHLERRLLGVVIKWDPDHALGARHCLPSPGGGPGVCGLWPLGPCEGTGGRQPRCAWMPRVRERLASESEMPAPLLALLVLWPPSGHPPLRALVKQQ